MLYDLKKLNERETLSLSGLLKHYQDYDKLDLLIELIIEDLDEFSNR
jgi:hypothetical protein